MCNKRYNLEDWMEVECPNCGDTAMANSRRLVEFSRLVDCDCETPIFHEDGTKTSITSKVKMPDYEETIKCPACHKFLCPECGDVMLVDKMMADGLVNKKSHRIDVVVRKEQQLLY